MALDSVHPLYSEFSADWIKMRDLYKGERTVKGKTVQYLPPTTGMVLDGMSSGQEGWISYQAYLLRAVFPEYVKEAVEAYIGALHMKPAKISLPAQLEPMRENATVNGESLQLLLRRINEEQLVSGRLGLLLDLPLVPDPTNPIPYIAMYVAEAVRNWDDGESGEGKTELNLVVVDESGFVRTEDFQWETQTKYRVLLLGDEESNETEGVYTQGVFSSLDGKPTFISSNMTAPSIRGTTLEEIPFVFVNSKDIVPQPDSPPLLGLGNEALTVYRGEADYRQHLFMTGQDTLVIIGGVASGPEDEEQPLRTGAGARIDIETGGDAKYIGVDSQGLPEQRTALENDRRRAETKSGQLISHSANDESGEALKTRLAAQTATLNQIALAGAGALQKILRIAARWIGANPEEVIVIPNQEFGRVALPGKELVDYMTARTMGAPISLKSLHEIMVSRGLTKMEFEDEQELIEEENANSGGLGVTKTEGQVDA